MRTSKVFTRVISLITLLLLLIALEISFGLLLEPISYATYFNHDIKELKAENADADLIFVGASRVYRSFVPEIFETELEMDNVINAGSSSQPISGSYFQLKELFQSFNPEYVVLGVSGDALRSEYYTQANLIVLDRLHGLNRLQYAFEVFKPVDLPYVFLDSFRFRNNLSPYTIEKNIREKLALSETGFEDNASDEEFYADKGFVYSHTEFIDGNVTIMEPINAHSDLNYSELEYLDKIVKLCEEKNTKLILVTGPTTMMRIYNSEVYQACHEWYCSYAEKNELTYHNLNYLRDRESFLPDSLMHDYNHVNGEGARVISKIYAEILSKTIAGENTDEYFYASFEELTRDVNRVVAVEAEIVTDNDVAEISLRSLHNEDVKPLYQISASHDGENYEVLLDWTYASEFELDVSEYDNLTLMVRAKTGSENEIEAFQYYTISTGTDFVLPDL